MHVDCMKKKLEETLKNIGIFKDHNMDMDTSLCCDDQSSEVSHSP